MYSKLQAVPSDIFFKSKNSEINQKIPSRDPGQLSQMQGLLNSQRIQLLFNHYDVEVLLQDGCLRVTNLNSHGAMRTCAMVHFASSIPDWLQETHNKIYNGGSIGQTIKDDGFPLTKKDSFLGVTELPEFAKLKMNTDENTAAVHIYQLVVSHPETTETVMYCTITEVHSPQYLTIGDLLYLTPATSPVPYAVTEKVQQCFDELSGLDQLLKHGVNVPR
ncbi:MAG: hypothetical protein P4L79_17380 [Legionella sp.]|uniref:hypothetical protein n=1 Tax=Legionella sp. TaxID=459 RepID=UPI002842CDB2|nr:hypothetical protein [Legionella sp.]